MPIHIEKETTKYVNISINYLTRAIHDLKREINHN
jgi:hypothetical protein